MALMPLPPGSPTQVPVVPNPAKALRFLSIHGSEVSFDLAAKLSGIFSGQISANDQAYMLELIALTDREDPIATDADGNEVATRYGVGLRILFRVSTPKAGFHVGFGSIGAALQLGLVTATYDVLQYGLNAVEAVSTLLNDFPDGTVSADTFLKLNSELLLGVHTAIANDPGSLAPQAVAVRMQSGELSLLNASRSIVYAIENIKERHSQSDAIKFLPKGLSREYVARAYDQIAGRIAYTDTPGSSAAARAKSWLST